MARMLFKFANDWLTPLTNVAVLAGLIVLVIEVDQNTTALKNESDVAVYGLAAENASLLVQASDLRQAYYKANTSPGATLSTDEKLLLSVYWGNEVDRAELQFRLYKRNGSELDNIVFFEPDLKLPAFREWWAQARTLYEPEFVRYLDVLMAEGERR